MREAWARGRPRVGMALYGDLTYDSRVQKEARTLATAGCDVSIVCLAAGHRPRDLPDNVTVLTVLAASQSVMPGALNPFRAATDGRLARLIRGAGWLGAYIMNLRAWGRSATSACGRVDIWHAHDLTGLAAIAPVVDHDVPIVYDSHELFVESGTAIRLPEPARTFLRGYERRLVSRVSAVITVNDEIARILGRRYRPNRIEVVHNCPERWTPPASPPTLIRDGANIRDDAPIILYHGSLSTGRGIENLMEALLMPGLENAHLALMGFGPRREEYARQASDARWRCRVHVLDPVPPDALLSWVASADVGAMPNPGLTLNDYLSTPNKLFECFAAGIPVVASDCPTMHRIVIDDVSGPLGAVCDPSRIEDIAAALRSILDLDAAATASLRARCLAAAQERWNWQAESAKLAVLYRDLVRGIV